jgi:hypothetical protein
MQQDSGRSDGWLTARKTLEAKFTSKRDLMSTKLVIIISLSTKADAAGGARCPKALDGGGWSGVGASRGQRPNFGRSSVHTLVNQLYLNVK